MLLTVRLCPSQMAIEIRKHEPGKDIDAFIRAGFLVLGGDPAWIPPLDFVLKDRLNPKKDPSYEHCEVALFTAWKDGRLVGRTSATVDRTWLSTWEDDTGHFGYFDTLDDAEVASALLGSAEGWLREKGMKRVNGPMSLNANQEAGILIEGFEHPPALDMPHSRAYQGALLEKCGYRKEKDLWCWRWDAAIGFNERTLKAWEEMKQKPEISLRPMSIKRLREELRITVDIYNETWAGKWGYIPISQAEIDKMVNDFSFVLDPDIAFVAEVSGEPAGVCIMVPNLNEVTADFGGKLFPFNWAKLLYRTKVTRPKSTRLMLLGVREKFRKNVKRYGTLSAAMYVEAAKRGLAKGYEWAELSWTREDDSPINLGIRSMGGKVHKKYRVYEKSLVL